MRKRISGMELLCKKLRCSQYGPIKNMFVIQALEKFALEVAKAKIPANFIIHPEAWKGVAKEVLADIEEAFPRV